MSVAAPRTITVPVVEGTILRATVELPDEIQILEGKQPKGLSCFRILDPEKGDERLTWDSRSFDQIKAAKKLFVDLVKKGLKPFRVGTNGQATSEVMTEFDAHAEEVLFLPYKMVRGG